MEKDGFDDEILVCFYERLQENRIESVLFEISNNNIYS